MNKFPINIFNEISNLNPSWSSYECFVETVKNKKLPENIVRKYFNSLVDKEDYDKSEKSSILGFIGSLVRGGS